MANIKQQKKRILTDRENRLRNRIFKSKISTSLKKSQQAIADRSTNASQLVSLTVKLLDKAKNKKIKKVNFVNRHKSNIMRKLANSLVKSAK